MGFVVVGIGGLLALGVSDGIEATDWYKVNQIVKDPVTGLVSESWTGYAMRYGIGIAIVAASLAIANAVEK